MKPVNILLLVLAGALGGAVIMKVTERPRRPVVARRAVEQTTAPTVQTAAVPAPPEPEPTVAPVVLETPVVGQTRPSASGTNAAAPAGPSATPASTSSVPAAPPVTPVPSKRKSSSPGKRVEATPAPPRVIYSDARPSPFHREPPKVAKVEVEEPPPPVAAAAPQEPVQQSAPQPQYEPPVQQQTAAPPVSPAPPARTEQVAPTPVPPAPESAPHTAMLNAGILISVRLVDGLSSERNASGDFFLATLDRELVADGFVIAERGARVEGRVVNVDRGTKLHGGATLAVELIRLHTSDNQNVPIQTDSFEKRSEPNRTTDTEKIGGGAAIGAIIGALAGGGKGAAVGAGAGAGAGTGDVLLTRKPATLPSETRITFRLRNPVTLTERLASQ